LAGPGRSLSGVLCRALSNLFWEVPRKQNDAVPLGAGKAPKRDTEQRTGYEAEDSLMHRSHSLDLGGARSPKPQPFSLPQRVDRGTAQSTLRCVHGSSVSRRWALSETSWAVQPKWQHDGTS
jgi:hypothetical protein